MANDILFSILHEAFLLTLLTGALFALLVGLLFFLSPRQGLALSQRYNRWLSLRRSTRQLELPHSIERPLYRHHRLLGLVVLLSVSYILYRFGFDYQRDAVIALLARDTKEAIVVEWLLDSLVWFLVPVSMLLVVVGALLALSPSALKGVEQRANTWISTRKMLQPTEKQYYFLESWVERHPRLFGILLSFAASYNLSLFLIIFLTNPQ